MTDTPARSAQEAREFYVTIGVAASVIGVLTGLIVLGIEHAVDDILKEVFKAPVWVPAVVVVAGALLTVVVVKVSSGGGTATTEVYVQDFHLDEPSLQPRHAPGRLLGAFTTLASGAPLGMEGPAVYSGSAIATWFKLRWPSRLAGSANMLLVAGAAAGVAAVFKAPAAAAIFALEVPYRGRMASERVLPALFGSATGFLTMASVDGFEPELPLPAVDLTYGRVAATALLGAVVAVIALGVVALIGAAENATSAGHPYGRALVAGGGLAAIYAIGRGASDESITLASGNNVIEWVLDPSHGVWLLLLILVLRIAGPAVSIVGGGVGGLFIPLMAIGAVTGRLFADAGSIEDLTLYVIVGAATMLGVGYGAPVTGVVFIAEYTGQAAVIVPSLVAMTVAVLIVGNRSVSHHQRT
ncbi:MAG: chloride channel protein [Acidimicrobiales bacterium]